MEKTVIASAPIIAASSKIPAPVLNMAELATHCDKIQGVGTWQKGIKGHVTLPIILDDGATPNRKCLIQFKAHSEFGLSFFMGKKDESEDDKPKETKEKGKKGKKKVQAASIAFDWDTNRQIQDLDMLLNLIVHNIVQDHTKTLMEMITPGRIILLTQRSAARASSGSTIRNLRITAKPGKVQIEGPTGVCVSMKDFLMGEEGTYGIVAHFSGIDAYYTDGAISYGHILTAKMIKVVHETVEAPLEWREDDGKALTVSADTVAKFLAKEKKEKKKEKKKKEKERKDLLQKKKEAELTSEITSSYQELLQKKKRKAEKEPEKEKPEKMINLVDFPAYFAANPP